MGNSWSVFLTVNSRSTFCCCQGDNTLLIQMASLVSAPINVIQQNLAHPQTKLSVVSGAIVVAQTKAGKRCFLVTHLRLYEHLRQLLFQETYSQQQEIKGKVTCSAWGAMHSILSTLSTWKRLLLSTS